MMLELYLLFCSRIYFKFFDSTLLYNLGCLSVSLLFLYVLVIHRGWKLYVGDRVVFKAVLPAILSIFSMVSVFWSIAPKSTLKASLFFFITTCLAYSLIAQRKYIDLPRVEVVFLRYFYFVIFGSSIFLFAGVGVMPEGVYEGAANGIFPHKNLLGRVSAIAILFVAAAARFRGLAAPMVVLATFLLIDSESKGAALFLVITLMLFYSINSLGKGGIKMLMGSALISIFPLVAFFAIKEMEYVLAFIGKDTTLTGRLPLWQFAITNIQQSIFLGHGYDAFWVTRTESGLSQYDINWTAPHAHNGFLDVGLELGLLGLFLYVAMFFNGVASYLALVKRGRGRTVAPFFIIFLYIFISNFLEKTAIQYFDVQWIMFLISYLVMHRERWRVVDGSG